MRRNRMQRTWGMIGLFCLWGFCLGCPGSSSDENPSQYETNEEKAEAKKYLSDLTETEWFDGSGNQWIFKDSGEFKVINSEGKEVDSGEFSLLALTVMETEDIAEILT